MTTRWTLTGTELVDPRGDVPLDAGRRAEISWVDGLGLVAASGSEWVIQKLCPLDGGRVGLGPAGVGHVIEVDLTDPASAYWAVTAVLWHPVAEGDTPGPTWVDTTPTGAVN